MLCFFSCGDGVRFYLDGEEKDTIASSLYVDSKYTAYPGYKIVFNDSIYKEADIYKRLNDMGFLSMLESKYDTHSPELYFYVYKGNCWNLRNSDEYDDERYYLKGRFSFLNNEKKLVVTRNEKMVIAEKRRLINDSIANVLAAIDMDLSFNGIRIGELYSKKREFKGGRNLKGKIKLLGYNVERVDVYDCNDTIYKIVAEIVQLRFETELEPLLKLYREKYGKGYVGQKDIFWESEAFHGKREKWVFKNGEICIDIYGTTSFNAAEIKKVLITYVDYKLDSIAKIEIYNDSIKAIKTEKEFREKGLEKVKEII